VKIIKRNNRRGLSTIVSILLMIFVAVACSVLTYSWIISMIGYQSMRAQTEIRIEQVTWIDSRNFMVTVREMGALTAMLESVSINKSQSTMNPELVGVNTSISPGTVNELHVTLSATTLENNTSYVIRVTTNTGFFYECNSFTGIIQ
jgi:hypothetical protein